MSKSPAPPVDPWLDAKFRAAEEEAREIAKNEQSWIDSNRARDEYNASEPGMLRKNDLYREKLMKMDSVESAKVMAEHGHTFDPEVLDHAAESGWFFYEPPGA